jgi:hypothetical protein
LAPASSRPRWVQGVETRAYSRLRALRSRGLWDGHPPVPIEHVVEHLLNLHIVWEDVEDPPEGIVLACLRPQSREIVLNERHRMKFAEIRGLERFSLGHESGHADIFALSAVSASPGLDCGLDYTPVRRSATNGEVIALSTRLSQLDKDERVSVLQALAETDRARWVAGEDSPRVKRAVDHYAAVLLMPQDLVRDACATENPQEWGALYRIAELFQVSISALAIRLKELGLIFGVEKDTHRILLSDPGQIDQIELFGP